MDQADTSASRNRTACTSGKNLPTVDVSDRLRGHRIRHVTLEQLVVGSISRALEDCCQNSVAAGAVALAVARLEEQRDSVGDLHHLLRRTRPRLLGIRQQSVRHSRAMIDQLLYGHLRSV